VPAHVAWSLLDVGIVRSLPVEARDALGHARNGNLARGLDPLFVQFRRRHFRLHVNWISERMLVHNFCINI